jgi:hypothetical protein
MFYFAKNLNKKKKELKMLQLYEFKFVNYVFANCNYCEYEKFIILFLK